MTHVTGRGAVNRTIESQRSFVGGDQRRWQVREVGPPAYDRRASASLIFYTDEVMRRVRQFPPNWRELSDEELYALSMAR
jgi:hypothetical protein